MIHSVLNTQEPENNNHNTNNTNNTASSPPSQSSSSSSSSSSPSSASSPTTTTHAIHSNTDNNNNTTTSPYRRSSQISALLNNPTDISSPIKNEDRNYTISPTNNPALLNNLSSSLNNNSTINTQPSTTTTTTTTAAYATTNDQNSVNSIVKQRRKSSVYDENGNRTQALLSTSSPEGIAAASMVTPNRIARLLKEKGSMPIRDITAAMGKQIPGFSSLSISKQRRLIMACLESGDIEESCVFEKIGWGQWAAKQESKETILELIQKNNNAANANANNPSSHNGSSSLPSSSANHTETNTTTSHIITSPHNSQSINDTKFKNPDSVTGSIPSIVNQTENSVSTYQFSNSNPNSNSNSSERSSNSPESMNDMSSQGAIPTTKVLNSNKKRNGKFNSSFSISPSNKTNILANFRRESITNTANDSHSTNLPVSPSLRPLQNLRASFKDRVPSLDSAFESSSENESDDYAIEDEDDENEDDENSVFAMDGDKINRPTSSSGNNKKNSSSINAKRMNRVSSSNNKLKSGRSGSFNNTATNNGGNGSANNNGAKSTSSRHSSFVVSGGINKPRKPRVSFSNHNIEAAAAVVGNSPSPNASNGAINGSVPGLGSVSVSGSGSAPGSISGPSGGIDSNLINNNGLDSSSMPDNMVERSRPRVSFSNASSVTRQSFIRTTISPHHNPMGSHDSNSNLSINKVLSPRHLSPDNDHSMAIDDDDEDGYDHAKNNNNYHADTDEEDWETMGAESLRNNSNSSTVINSVTTQGINSEAGNAAASASVSSNRSSINNLVNPVNSGMSNEEMAALALMDLKSE
ncbi:hypothetical protein BVG19_g407 [[Candida] boidinii]|nr:hypothetical protein BVG19_g407 [[Candida] boidinii]OWB50200.1 hypothetical protein B5S27_g1748 [[Candida] boidinii]